LPLVGVAPINRAAVFAIVALALMMMSIDSTIVATALHTMQRELHTSINWAGWIITAYAFGFVVMLPVSGKLSKQYGHRRVFLGSVAVFTAASLACGLVERNTQIWCTDVIDQAAAELVWAGTSSRTSRPSWKRTPSMTLGR